MDSDETRQLADPSAADEKLARAALISSIGALVFTVFAAWLDSSAELQEILFWNPLSLVGYLGIPLSVVGLRLGAAGLKSDSRRLSLMALLVSSISLSLWGIIVLRQ